MDDFNKIPRPVHRSDFLVIFTGFLHNLMQTFETLTAELFELSIYHSNRKTKTSQAWEEMAQDLETLGEDK
jgi:hypothetical protein